MNSDCLDSDCQRQVALSPKFPHTSPIANTPSAAIGVMRPVRIEYMFTNLSLAGMGRRISHCSIPTRCGIGGFNGSAGAERAGTGPGGGDSVHNDLIASSFERTPTQGPHHMHNRHSGRIRRPFAGPRNSVGR